MFSNQTGYWGECYYGVGRRTYYVLLSFLHISKVNETARVFHPPLELQSTQLIKTITHKD